MSFLTLEQYLRIRGVVVHKDKFKASDNIKGVEAILRQIKLIAMFHKVLNEYPYGLSPTIHCRIGEDIEEMNLVYRKINKKLLNSCYPEAIKKKIDDILFKAKESLKYIGESNPLILMKRSMDNEEMILGDCGFKHLKYQDTIEISSMKGICYNILESDYGKFLVKQKKSNIAGYFEEFIGRVIEVENLGYNSEKFLKGYIAFPHQTLNMLQKYKDGKVQWDEETFCYKFMESYKSDSSLGL